MEKLFIAAFSEVVLDPKFSPKLDEPDEELQAVQIFPVQFVALL